MRYGQRRSQWWIMVVACVTLAAGCARRPRVTEDPTPSGGALDPRRPGGDLASDPSRVYQRLGLLAENGMLPFVGSLGYFATTRPDTTLMAVTLSLANNALTFQREGDRYRATYAVQVAVRQGANTVSTNETEETVRVASFKETTREDESVIAQRMVNVAPGEYVLAVTIRDIGSGRLATEEATIRVPRVGAPGLSTPLVVHEADPRGTLDSLPRVVASPRATRVFGRDTTFSVYLEGYTSSPQLPVTLSVRSERGAPLWTNTVSLPRHGAMFSGVLQVPVSTIGVGIATLVVSPAGTTDSVKAPLFVSFGEDLPVASFEEMLGYLRYFTTTQRLQALRDAPPEQRAAAWSRFLAETDPNPTTAINEGLRDYFQRVRLANERFRDEGGSGWTTDRGMVFVALGEPDQMYEQGSNDVSQRGRAQIWEYREYGIQLVFVDQSGFGRWRLTTSSEADFQSAVGRTRNTNK